MARVLSQTIAYVKTQTFPTDDANCKGQILGLKPNERAIPALKTLNNEFVESGLERYDLRHR